MAWKVVEVMAIFGNLGIGAICLMQDRPIRALIHFAVAVACVSFARDGDK